MSTLPSVPWGAVGAARSTWRLVNDPVGLLAEWSDRLGHTFQMPLLNGPGVVTGDPALIAAIFGESALFDAPNEIAGPLVGEGSIVLAEGARHKRKRKLLAPLFHGQRLRSYAHIIADAARRHAAALSPGPVQALDLTQRLSLDVIIRAVFGVADPARVEVFRTAILRNVDAFPAWLMFMPALHHRLFGPWAAYQRSVEALIGLLREELDRARAELSAGVVREDILAMLLLARDEAGEPMPDPEIVDELRTMVVAGHETTATTLGWALWQVHRHPHVLQRVRAEMQALGPAPAPEAVARLPYLAAVCDETLRMHPIAPIFRRRLLRDATLAGVRYPAGTVFHPSPLIAHFDPTRFEEPHQFKPERFLGHTFGPAEFFPFGGGNRRCIGAAFASFELQIALGTLATEHQFTLLSDRPIRLVLNGVTTRPVGGIPLHYQGPVSGRGGASG